MNTTDVVRRFFAEAVEKGDLGVVDELVAPEFSGRFPISPEPLTGPEGYRQVVTTLRTAFPDLTAHVEEIVADGERVIVVIEARGTHNGDLLGVPPTGNTVSWPVVHVMGVRDKQIVSDWVIFDRLDLMAQLGIDPEGR
jgi:steroid delta-isomerase-like uncharacterized protein